MTRGAFAVCNLGDLPGPQKHVNNRPKPLKTAQKAIALHTFEVQV